MRLMPAEERNAMFAVYAFCREVDDIADDEGLSREKYARLQEWRSEILHLFDGQPAHPITFALSYPIKRFGFSKEDFLHVIEGMEIDSNDGVRMADMCALRNYCDKVSCAVGRISVRVFGLRRDLGDRLAKALGEALQLTNILRDLLEDARVDKLYLPQTLLDAHHVVKANPVNVLSDSEIPSVCEDLAQIAQSRFDAAAEILQCCPHRSVRPARLMMESYHIILQKLMARGWYRLEEEVRLSTINKLWLILRYGLI